MYTGIVIFQSLCVFLTIFTCVSLILAKPMREGKFLYFSIVATTIQSLGYLLEILAKDQGTALTAVKFEYVGLCFGFLMLLIYVFRVCHIKAPKALFPILSILNIITVTSVLTCEYHTLYYSWIDYSYDWLYPHLVFGRGPLYWVHMAVMVVMIFIIVGASLRRYAVSKKSGRHEFTFLRMLFSFGVVTLLLLAGYLTGFFGYYDPTPVTLMLICVFVRFNIFDISESAVEVAVNTIKESIIVVDNDYRYVDCNSEAKKVFPQLDDISAGTRIGNAIPLLEEILLTKSNKEFKNNDKYYQCYITEITRKNKEIKGYIACLIDVTESYLNVREIISMKNKADSANRAKSEFLANVSHEIRTPMNAILGMTELALNEDVNDTVRENLYDIKSAGNTLLALINDILDFSRIESNKTEINNDQYGFSSMISDSINIALTRINPTKIDFIQKIDKSIPKTLYGDALRIRQVLLNLLTNASKYTEKGFIELSAEWTKDGDDTAILKISVKDSGIGISKSNLPKLFTSFQRVDSRKNCSIEGAGLGLAISKKLLDLMGGKIEVESEYGKGSTFSFILPQKIIDASPCDYDANYHGHDNNDTAIFKNEFIAPDAKALVVDDNPVNLKIACGFLKNYQLDVDTATSGEECLDMILTKKYDIIFLDYMMPRLDGIDTLQLIRAKKIDDEYFAEVPVIALTADAISGVKNKFKMVGFQEFITKPIQFQKLENVLREYLPKKYIIEKTEEQTQSDNEKADFSIPFVETDIGIENCGGTVDDYIQILEIFYKFGSDKISKIKQMLDDGNIKDYTIEVHSLKSSAANIGALEVSKLARELEMAGKEEKVEVIRNKNDDMLRKYSSLLDNIKSVLDKNN